MLDFLPNLNNWAINDLSVVKVKESNADKAFDFAYELLGRGGEFMVRYAVTMLMSNFLKQPYFERVFQFFENIKYGQYNVDMAAAWLLATAFSKTYDGDLEGDKTLSFMRNSLALNKFTFNKALQKMRESYRVDDTVKPYLNGLKIK